MHAHQGSKTNSYVALVPVPSPVLARSYSSCLAARIALAEGRPGPRLASGFGAAGLVVWEPAALCCPWPSLWRAARSALFLEASPRDGASRALDDFARLGRFKEEVLAHLASRQGTTLVENVGLDTAKAMHLLLQGSILRHQIVPCLPELLVGRLERLLLLLAELLSVVMERSVGGRAVMTERVHLPLEPRRGLLEIRLRPSKGRC